MITTKPALPTITKKNTHRNPHALFIDDDKILNLYHKERIERCGVSVDIIANPSTYLRSTTLFSPIVKRANIVFIEVSLPKVRIQELINFILSVNRQVPIIAIYTNWEEAKKYYAPPLEISGIANIEKKPLSYSKIKAILSHHLPNL